MRRGCVPLDELARAWGWAALEADPEKVIIPGSPERVPMRLVVRSPDGMRWLLERLAPSQKMARAALAGTLATLAQEGCPGIPAYRAAASGWIVKAGRADWMLSPYVESDVLPRDRYAHEAARGRALADFLLCLRRASARMHPVVPGFRMAEYLRKLIPHLERVRGGFPDLSLRLVDELDYLKVALLNEEERWPFAFCHGDYHPLNISWRGSEIRAVIDWEFCGRKLELYDAALLIGCLAFDDPAYLRGALAWTFLGHLRAAGWGDALSWERFPALVMAIRFAWLREWVARGDRAVAEWEIEGIHRLFVSRHELAV